MSRRLFLQALAAGGAVLSSGCAGPLPFVTTRLESDDVFDDYRFDGTDLVVEFRDDVDVHEAVLFDSHTVEEYETVDQPGRTVRFPVFFPDRLETRLSKSPSGNGRDGRRFGAAAGLGHGPSAR